MSTNTSTILGISLGTRSTGIAVLQGKELEISGVHSFNERWSESKVNSIISMISKYVSEHAPGKIVIKTPKPTHHSEAILHLLDCVKDIARSANSDVHVINFNDFATHEPTIKTRRDLRLIVVGRHPELIQALRKDQQNKRHYYCKLFEAILAAEIGNHLHTE